MTITSASSAIISPIQTMGFKNSNARESDWNIAWDTANATIAVKDRPPVIQRNDWPKTLFWWVRMALCAYALLYGLGLGP
jgi:hypothetical protein